MRGAWLRYPPVWLFLYFFLGFFTLVFFLRLEPIHSDITTLLPHVHQIDEPELFQNDIAFSGSPASTHFSLMLWILAIGRRFCDISSVYAVVIILNLILFIGSMFRVFETVGRCGRGGMLAAMFLVVFLDVEVNGFTLIGGTGHGSYLSLSLWLMGLSFLMEGRLIPAATLSGMAIHFHVVTGLPLALVLLLGAFLMREPALEICKAAGVLFLFCLLIPSDNIQAYHSNRLDADTTQISANVLRFIRAPWHFDISQIGDAQHIDIAILGVCTILVLVLNGCRRDEKPIVLAGGASLFLLVLGIVNGLYIHNQVLMIVCPYFGPHILLPFLYFVTMRMNARLSEGWICSTVALLLTAPVKRAFFCSLVVTELVHRFWGRESGRKGGGHGPESQQPADCALAVILVVPFVVLCSDLGSIRQVAALACLAAMGGLLLRLQPPGAAGPMPERFGWNCLLTIGVWGIGFPVLVGLCAALFPGRIVLNKQTDMVSGLHMWIREHTPKDAVFVISPHDMDFRYASKRAAFFTFKHFPRRADGMREWAERMKMLRLIPADHDLKHLSLPVRWNDSFGSLKEEDFRGIRMRYPMVQYCLTRKTLDFPIVYDGAPGGERLYEILLK